MTDDVLKAWKLAGIEHFNPIEFDSPDSPSSGVNMNIEFIRILEAIRKDCGFALVVLSGYRTPTRNAQVGGVQDSEHTQGNGADIEALDGATRFSIIQSALKNGIKRIGIGKTFVHLGMSYSLPQNVIWRYDDSGKSVA